MPSSQVWELFIGAKELWWIREWFEWCLIMSDAPLRISNHFLSIIRDNKEQTTKKWFYQICASFTTIMETEESGAGIVFCVFDISNQRWVEDNWIESKWPLIIPSAEHMVTCHQQVSGGVILIMMVMRVMIVIIQWPWLLTLSRCRPVESDIFLITILLNLSLWVSPSGKIFSQLGQFTSVVGCWSSLHDTWEQHGAWCANMLQILVLRPIYHSVCEWKSSNWIHKLTIF